MSGLYKMFFDIGERSSCGPDSLAFYTLYFGEELFSVAHTISLGRATFRSCIVELIKLDKIVLRSSEFSLSLVTGTQKEVYGNHLTSIQT